MTTLVHIADRVLNRPLLISSEKAQVVLTLLSGRLGVNAPDASRFEGDNVERDENGNTVFGTNAWGERVPKRKPYNVKNGVAVITITGSLVNRGAWIGAHSGLTSYEGIGHQIKTARDDPTVHSVIIDIDSPGGEAVGTFEVAALVRELAAKKRTIAVVNGMAASAAYAIASGANDIVTTETGVAGSIGVVLLHADFSRQLDRDGITPTLIHAGAHKVDGNPFEPLSAVVRDDLQAEVNAFYDAFLKTVAKGRGNRLTAAAARKTEARVFVGEAAVDAGIADRVGSFETVLSELSRATSPSGGRSTSQTGRQTMSETSGAPAAETAGISRTDHDAAMTAAEQRGASSERARLQAALGADGVRGNAARMSAALDLANKSPSMSGTDIAGFVSENVGAGQAEAYEAQRVAASGLAQPGGKKPDATVSWADFRAKRKPTR